MGEAKRRKAILGDGYAVKYAESLVEESEIEFKETLVWAIFLSSLLGVKSWRQQNPRENWRSFFHKKIQDVLLDPNLDYANISVKSREGKTKIVIISLFTVVITNPPLLFSSKSNYKDYLIEQVTQKMTVSEIGALLNDCCDVRTFIYNSVQNYDSLFVQPASMR
jgi:hypothetical protein